MRTKKTKNLIPAVEVRTKSTDGNTYFDVMNSFVPLLISLMPDRQTEIESVVAEAKASDKYYEGRTVWLKNFSFQLVDPGYNSIYTPSSLGGVCIRCGVGGENIMRRVNIKNGFIDKQEFDDKLAEMIAWYKTTEAAYNSRMAESERRRVQDRLYLEEREKAQARGNKLAADLGYGPHQHDVRVIGFNDGNYALEFGLLSEQQVREMIAHYDKVRGRIVADEVPA